MGKKMWIAVGVIVAIFGVLIGVSVFQRTESDERAKLGSYDLNVVTEMAERNDYSEYDVNEIITPDEQSGNLPENVKGSTEAPIVIFEYGDYQCSYCAAMNPLINQMVKDYDGKVAVVLRTYVLSYHNNGVQAASAANAAAIQGYWEEYKDLLFANQNEWFYSTAEKLQGQLEQYFEQATDGKGDLEKFRKDMKSEAVRQKLAFDQGLGDKVDIGGTPWFYLDGKWIDNTGDDGKGLSPADYAKRMRVMIEAKLEQR